MVFGVLVDIAVGALLIVLGLLIWKKQKISILHDYHYKNVKKADIPEYTKHIGIGLIIIGAGIAVTGVLNIFESSLWWIPILVGFVIGIIKLYRTQKKYNGSVLG